MPVPVAASGPLAAAWSTSVPALTVVLPASEFRPVSVSVPVPVLIRLPGPERLPEYVVLALLPPIERATAAGVAALFCSTSGPVPVRPPTAKALPATALENARLPVVVSSVLAGRAFGVPSASVPPSTRVGPVKVLVPESVSVPVPTFTRPRLPWAVSASAEP